MKRVESNISVVRILYIVTTLFLVGLTLYVFLQIRNADKSSKLVAQADKVNLAAGKALVYLLNAETDQKNFLLLQDTTQLAEKKADLNLMQTELLRLDTLSEGNERLRSKTESLQDLIREKLQSMEEVLRSYRQGDAPEIYRANIVKGITLMKNIRMSVKLLVDSEKALLDTQTQEMKRSEQLTPALLIILFIGSLLILFASYFRINFAFRREQALKDELSISAAELQQKNIEQEERSNFTEALLNASPNHIFVVDRDIRVIAANKKMIEDFRHISESDIIGKKLKDFDANLPTENIVLAFSGREIFVPRFGSLISDRIYELSYIPLLKQNEVNAVMIVTHDITTLERAREEISLLNQSHEYAEQVGLFGSYRYNFALQKLTYSDNLFRLLGVEPGSFEPNGDSFLAFVHPEDKAYVQDATAAAFTEQKISRWEYRLITAQGKTIYVRGTGKLIRDEAGLCMVGTLQDITEEKQMELSLKQNFEALQRMNEELSSFAYIAGHDLQEPLRKIRIFANQIMEQGDTGLSPQASDKFARMQKAAERMQMLIDDLLTYSKTATAERKYEMVNVGEYVKQVLENMHEEIGTAGAQIETGAMCTAKVIPFQLRQLLTNLIGNAIKFRDPLRTPVIKIYSVEEKRKAPGADIPFHYCRISIEDNGIGFEEEYSQQIFKVFQRLNERQAYSGTGIGLSIVKKIVDNHEGFIETHSVVGEGSRFDIYLKQDEKA